MNPVRQGLHYGGSLAYGARRIVYLVVSRIDLLGLAVNDLVGIIEHPESNSIQWIDLIERAKAALKVVDI